VAVERLPWQGSAVTTPRDRIGEVLGQRYELQAVIGQGGQGTVYRALDRWSQHAVAIKVMSAKATEPAAVERMMRELEALNALQGTAAVKVLDTFRGNAGELCLVLELLIGEDLDQYLWNHRERERMRPERIVELLDPIVSTLEVAHAAGILHRDLKPANIFLLQGGGVRLLDFGMARLRKGVPLTAPGMVMGSPSFMAPEAWQGLSDFLDPRADVYSLAVIIFVALTGELPLSGKDLFDKFLGATQGKHRRLREFRPDLPPQADEWAARALALDRNQRFGSVGDMWNAFFPAFRVAPPAHRRTSLWARAMGAVRKMAGSDPPAGSSNPSPAWTYEAPVPSFERPVEKTLDLAVNDVTFVDPDAKPVRRPPPPPPRK
jgi:serine/threonine-protein kinase